MGCDTNDRNNQTVNEFKMESAADGYHLLHVAFQNEPEAESIKKFVDPILKRHGHDIDFDNINRLGSMMIGIRKRSAVGVTEMDVLKHMYQNGSSNNTLIEQAAISAFYLEKTM
ncbi:hypothetical protein [Pedobacter flavus]|uniref:Uncharacterized protein n=1 Tax=Pedobacter flavus TaxID=3113906 RepID=A0ABU7GZD0_9SPHI|nr:hypothetical protein [Pedobacter sp. VNH31]MEE1884381.1 hypothetical protein [Pedobacter sp. VNH31]